MIPPTVGRVVWYFDELRADDKAPKAAMIAAVLGPSTINIGYLNTTGCHGNATFVPLLQEGDEVAPGTPHCKWMPFQVGQAKAQEAAQQSAPAKTEKLKPTV